MVMFWRSLLPVSFRLVQEQWTTIKTEATGPLTHQWLHTNVHGIISQKYWIFFDTAVMTSFSHFYGCCFMGSSLYIHPMLQWCPLYWPHFHTQVSQWQVKEKSKSHKSVFCASFIVKVILLQYTKFMCRHSHLFLCAVTPFWWYP
jgi:hypothetical protein